MATRPTAGWTVSYNDDEFMILTEFSETLDGDDQDVSGTGDTQGTDPVLIRRKREPIDTGTEVTFTGLADMDSDGFDAVDTALRTRQDITLRATDKDGNGYDYTGFRGSYNPNDVNRSDQATAFSFTFIVNSESGVGSFSS